MTKKKMKPDHISLVIKDLIESLVHYADYIKNPPEGEETIPDKETYRFVIKNSEQRVAAISTILFGEAAAHPRAGNISYEEKDRELMLELKREMRTTGKTKEALIDKYVPMAKRRNNHVDDESVRSRLEDVYYRLAHEKDYGENVGAGFEGYARDGLTVVLPWLYKYREEIIKLLKP